MLQAWEYVANAIRRKRNSILCMKIHVVGKRQVSAECKGGKMYEYEKAGDHYQTGKA